MSDSVQVILKYGGSWSNENNFINYKVGAMMLPCDATFGDLKTNIRENINHQDNGCEMQISYKMQAESYPFPIESDKNLAFYVNVKKSVADPEKYPLCVTFVERNEYVQESSNMEISVTHNRTSDSANRNQMISITDLQRERKGKSILNAVEDIHTMEQYSAMLATNFISEIDNLRSDDDSENEGDDSFARDKINVGDTFPTKNQLQNAVCHYSIINGFNFKVEKSNGRCYWVRCIDSNCPWMFKASSVANTKEFKVRKFTDVHTCSLEDRAKRNKQATSHFIANVVKMKYRNTSSYYGPVNIQEDMKSSYGLDVDYSKAWRAKEIVAEQVIGKSSVSYQDLPSYLYMLETTNPGTITNLKTMEDRSFLYAFFALGSSIEGWKFCRPQVIVDGAFLSTPYGGTLITACTYNAAGGILPLAFAIVDSENNNAYKWFFESFREAFGVREGMCVISDRHQSIAHGVVSVYPEVGHYYCVYHIENNLKKVVHKNHGLLHKNFFKTAKSYTKRDFDSNFAELQKMSKLMEKILTDEIPIEKWAAIYASHNRRQAMTSNIAESLNARNKTNRNMPITVLMENIRSICQQWNVKFMTEATSTLTPLTSKYHDKILRRLIKSATYKVTASSTYVFKVTEEGQSFVVNIGTNSCSCGKFQQDELPCRHAVAVLRERGYDMSNFTSIYYLTSTLKSTYNTPVNPISKEDTYNIPDDVASTIVEKPSRKPRAGKPKKTRLRSFIEAFRYKRCSRCNQSRHNRKTCPNLPTKDV